MEGVLTVTHVPLASSRKTVGGGCVLQFATSPLRGEDHQGGFAFVYPPASVCMCVAGGGVWVHDGQAMAICVCYQRCCHEGVLGRVLGGGASAPVPVPGAPLGVWRPLGMF